MNKVDLFLNIAKYNPEKKISEFVNILKSEKLQTGKNGGSWCRFDGKFGKYKAITVNQSGKIRYSWCPKDDEQKEILKDLKKYKEENNLNSKGTSIELIRIYGLQNMDLSRKIRSDIINTLKTKKCVSCGTTNDIEIDHKNGLYNDPRVLNIITQQLTDFQPLCRHCNLEKRQIIKKMKKTGIRPSALQHPLFKFFGVSFTSGDETFNIKDPNALVGTLWYDFEDFALKMSQKS